MHEFIIIGSGPSGTAAAWELRDRRPLVLDVGFEAPDFPPFEQDIFTLKKNDPQQQQYILGDRFESLVNINSPDPVSVKLKAPLISFVLRQPGILKNLNTRNFAPFLSYAYGGLANAWGAGAYRYDDDDLANFPFLYRDLEPFYNELTDLIGISGENDDLTPFFADIDNLQPPLPFNSNCGDFFNVYRKRKKSFNRKGIFLGRTQLTLLTRKLGNRRIYSNDNTSFYTCRNSAVYTPPITMDELRRNDQVNYMSGLVVTSFKNLANRVEVTAVDLETGKKKTFTGRHLLVAAGAVNSARILLNSYHDYSTELPLLDNPVSFVPFVNIRNIGTRTDMKGYEGGQLILIYQGKHYPQRVQGSIYSYISPLRSDVFFNFPFSLQGNLALSRYIVPAMTMLQLFYPDKPHRDNYVQLEKNGTLKLQYNYTPELGKVENHLIRMFAAGGFVSLPFLTLYPKPGNSIHYAGTVPMCSGKRKYSVDKDCRLNHAPDVYFIDGSVFPELPAKNLTFTLMANAMRVARNIKKT